MYKNPKNVQKSIVNFLIFLDVEFGDVEEGNGI
jgi:hypothetical protein